MSRKKITEENVDEFIKLLIERTKGKYITQGVSFNKGCPRQISLLRYALISSASFSGLAKELLALRFTKTIGGVLVPQQFVEEDEPSELDESILNDNANNWL